MDIMVISNIFSTQGVVREVTGKAEDMFDRLLSHYVVVSLFLVLFILSLIGVGNARIVSALGLLLCMVGLVQKGILADPWIIIPLIIYNLVNMASFYAVYGNLTDSYGSTQMIFPIIYLLITCLDSRDLLLLKRLCVLWTGFCAGWGIFRFVCGAVIRGGGVRLGGFLGNPNAMGIFLVIGWFALLDLERNREKTPFRLNSLIPYMEPLLLTALALTLSMGSYVSMAAGFLWYLWEERKRSSPADMVSGACMIMAKASLCFGVGLLMYLAASWTGVPASCVPILVYAAAVVFSWKRFQGFLGVHAKAARAMAVFGLVVAGAAVMVRPSAADTFAERLEMMENGFRYLGLNPFLGVGPYQWRLLNLHDGGKYFNTWHIHNTLLHIGVETGWIAMAMMILIVARVFGKKGRGSKAGFLAFCIHNMMDTSFFYMGITALSMMTAAWPGEGGKKEYAFLFRVVFALSAVLFAWNLRCALGG